jgi:hypothetical protein
VWVAGRQRGQMSALRCQRNGCSGNRSGAVPQFVSFFLCALPVAVGVGRDEQGTRAEGACGRGLAGCGSEQCAGGACSAVQCRRWRACNPSALLSKKETNSRTMNWSKQRLTQEQNWRKKKTKKIKCGERGSNTRPSDLQSDALPTELSPLGCTTCSWFCVYRVLYYYCWPWSSSRLVSSARALHRPPGLFAALRFVSVSGCVSTPRLHCTRVSDTA